LVGQKQSQYTGDEIAGYGHESLLPTLRARLPAWGQDILTSTQQSDFGLAYKPISDLS
jgi:hypothetical protein